MSGRLSSGPGSSPYDDFLLRAPFGAIFGLELSGFLVGFVVARSYKLDASKVLQMPSSGMATHPGRLFNS